MTTCRLNGAARRLRDLAGISLIASLFCTTSVTRSAWGQRPPSDPVQDLVLVGVVVGGAGGPTAALRDRRTGREAWYRVGDRIEDVRLSAVSSDRVAFQRAERTIELRLAVSQRSGDGRMRAVPPGRQVRDRAAPFNAPPFRLRHR